jgi:hypothetical protein
MHQELVEKKVMDYRGILIATYYLENLFEIDREILELGNVFEIYHR